MSKIQEHINLGLGVNTPNQHGENLVMAAEDFDELESSARIEHVDVDGSLEFNVVPDMPI